MRVRHEPHPESRVYPTGGAYYEPRVYCLAAKGSHAVWYTPGYMGFGGQAQRRRYVWPEYLLVRLASETEVDDVLLSVDQAGHKWRAVRREMGAMLTACEYEWSA